MATCPHGIDRDAARCFACEQQSAVLIRVPEQAPATPPEIRVIAAVTCEECYRAGLEEAARFVEHNFWRNDDLARNIRNMAAPATCAAAPAAPSGSADDPFREALDAYGAASFAEGIAETTRHPVEGVTTIAAARQHTDAARAAVETVHRDEVAAARKTLREVCHALGVCYCWDFGCEPAPEDVILDRIRDLTSHENDRIDFETAERERDEANARFMDAEKDWKRVLAERDEARAAIMCGASCGKCAACRVHAAEADRDRLAAEVEALTQRLDATRHLAAEARAAETREAEARAALPDDLRAVGWAVAVHNDYRLDGEPHTFWLLTHPLGRWIKGEGRTDAEALAQARAALSPRPSPGAPTEGAK